MSFAKYSAHDFTMLRAKGGSRDSEASWPPLGVVSSRIGFEAVAKQFLSGVDSILPLTAADLPAAFVPGSFLVFILPFPTPHGTLMPKK
jgi:hypothetical protein